jgi:hypothetical protein
MKTFARTTALCAAFGFVGAANAGCGLNLTFDNDYARPITVLAVEAKPTGGQYQVVYNNHFDVDAGRKVTKSIETQIGCAAPHNLRVKFKKGNTTLYTTKGPLVTAVDQNIKIRFDN